MASGYTNHFDGSPTPGVLPGVADKSILLNPGDVAAMRAAFASNNDIAAVILEPTGSSFGQVPLGAEFVQELRRLTHAARRAADLRRGGHRLPRAPRAARRWRSACGPTCRASPRSSPAGCRARRRGAQGHPRPARLRTRRGAPGREKIAHPGTFNANPVSAAAGTAALTVIAETDAVGPRLRHRGGAAREAERGAGRGEALTWAVYGTYSGFHLFVNPSGLDVGPHNVRSGEDPARGPEGPAEGAGEQAAAGDAGERRGPQPARRRLLSCTHTADDVAHTAAAFREAVRMLKQEGELPG